MRLFIALTSFEPELKDGVKDIILNVDQISRIKLLSNGSEICTSGHTDTVRESPGDVMRTIGNAVAEQMENNVLSMKGKNK